MQPDGVFARPRRGGVVTPAQVNDGVVVAAAAQIDDVVRIVTGRDRGFRREDEPHLFPQAEHIRQPCTDGHAVNAIDARETAAHELSCVTSVFGGSWAFYHRFFAVGAASAHRTHAV